MRLLALAFASLSVACAADLTRTAPDDLTSVEGVEHTIAFDGHVDVPAGAGDDVARAAIHRQLKSALGALRERGIGVADRDAQRNLAAATLPRIPLAVVAADGAVVAAVDRVHYHYTDVALVDEDTPVTGPIDLTLLFGDYVARFGELRTICSDDPASDDAGSLWYHFAPRRWSCRNAIRAEERAIADAQATLADASAQISAREADRRFLTVRATLTPAAAAPETWPEYDHLWGFAGDPARTTLVVYSFFGVDRDQADPYDHGLVEYLRFQRTIRARLPGVRVTETSPHAWLLDFWIDGEKITADWADVERWIVDRAGLPAQVAGDARKTADLLGQVVAHFSERWIVWSWPVTVRRGDVERTMTVELRTFYGYEDGSPEVRQRARWRYLEAFWHGDVFAYTGHSHFGHGPLEPWTYGAGNFPDRYQVMLVNSCLSFNYYDEDFLAIHPGGTSKLDVVVNGGAAYWRGMGEATADYVTALVDGESRSWREVLAHMAVDLPWEAGYDPMRAVNGELDNVFTPDDGAVVVTPR